MTDTFSSNPYRKALAGWDKDHWVKGYLNFQDKYCLWGRIFSVTSLLEDYARNRIENELELTINEMYPIEFNERTIVGFNDDSRTTFEDVQAVLEKSALKWDERYE